MLLPNKKYISKKTIAEISKRLADYLDIAYRDRKAKNGYYKIRRNERTASAKISKDGIFIIDYGDNYKHYNIFQLYALDKGLDVKTDFVRICEELADILNINIVYENGTKRENIYPTLPKICRVKEKQPTLAAEEEIKQDIINFADNYNIWHEELLKSEEALNYISKRGISTRLINQYNIGYCKERFYYFLVNGKPNKHRAITESLIFGINNYNFITRYLGKENEYQPKSKKVFSPEATSEEKIFNYNYLLDSSEKTKVFITEGIFNLLSIEELSEEFKAIATNSISSKNILLEAIKKANYKGLIYIIPDIDKSNTGLKGAKEICEELKAQNIKAYIYNYDFIDKTRTDFDINDILISDREKLKESIINFINNNI